MTLEPEKMDDPDIIFVLENDDIIKGMDERYTYAYTELAKFKKEYQSFDPVSQARWVEDLIQSWKILIGSINKTMLDIKDDWRIAIMDVRLCKLKLAFAKGFIFTNSVSL